MKQIEETDKAIDEKGRELAAMSVGSDCLAERNVGIKFIRIRLGQKLNYPRQM